MVKFNDNEGVWRTIGGRRVFIRKGQDLASAMKDSGKFKVANKKNERANTEQGKKEIKDKVKQLYSDTWNGKKDYNELKAELDKMKKSGDVTSEDIKSIREEIKDEYNKQHSATSYYAKMTKDEIKEDLEERKNRLDNNYYNEKDKKMYDDFYKQGKHDYESWYSKQESKEEDKKIETISQEEYDKVPKDYKGTIKELVDTAEFRGEKKEDVIKKYKDLGYDVENDKTILKLTDKGTTLTPVKVGNKETNATSEKEELEKAYKDYVNKWVHDDNYLQVNRPGEYQQKLLSKRRTFADEIKDKEVLEKHKLTNEDPSFKRQMLSRMQSDVDYYLGNGNGDAEHSLWAKNEDDHIAIMKSLYNTLPDKEKPDWLTMNQINDYEKKMKESKGSSSLSQRYAGTIDYMKNTTGLSMAQIMEIIKRIEKDKNK